MKILVIRIKNLASLEGTFEIDFTKEPLSSAGIFAITGPTGAGKSTLLDALCLALFAKTPRHIIAKESGVELQDGINNKIGQGDVRNILRKGTSDGYSEVEFQGIDEQTYKATWSVRRARNKAEGSLQSDTVELVNLTSNSRFPEKKTETLKEIERLIGLNFDQFTRSVLLAQGDFTAFLKADKDEKSSLLEKLTGTDIYSEISKKIYEKFKLAEQDLRDLQKCIEGINSLSDNELHDFCFQIEELNQKISLFENDTILLNSEIEWNNSLAVLLRDKIQSDNELQIAINSKDNASDRFSLLQIIENIQATRGFFETKINIETSLKEKNNELINLISVINNIENQLKDINSGLADSEILVAKAFETQKNAQISIEKAKALDTLLGEKKTNLESIEKEYILSVTEQKEKEIIVVQNELQLKDISNQLIALELWQKENSGRKAIADNINLIFSKLDDLKKYFIQKDKLYNEKQLKLNRKTVIQGLFQNHEKQLSTNNDVLEKLYLEYQINIKEIENVDIKLSNEKLAELNLSVEDITSSKGIWDLFYSSIQDCDLLQKRINDSKSEFNIQKKNLADENKILTTAQIKKEQTQKLLSKAELETAENVETLRDQLTENEACPVCGSLNHPYQRGYVQLHNVLMQLKNEFDECNTHYIINLQSVAAIGKHCEKLQTDLIGLEQDLNVKSVKHSEYQLKWTNLNFNKELHELADDTKSLWFDEKLDSIKKEILSLNLKIIAFDKVKLDTDNQKILIEKLERELIGIKNNLEIAQIDFQKNNEEIEALENISKQNDTEIKITKTLLDKYFINPDWLAGWNKNSNIFEEKLKTWMEEWHSKNKLIEDFNKNINVSETELKGYREHLLNIGLLVNKNKIKLDEETKIVTSFQQQRNNLFDGKEIILVEKELIANIESAQIIQKQLFDKKEVVNNELIKNTANKFQLTKDIQSLENQFNNLQIKIQDWILIYNNENGCNLNSEKISQLLEYSSEWILGERKVLEELNESITMHKATYTEREKKYNDHLIKKKSDRTLEEIIDLQLDVKSKLGVLLTEKNDIDFKLKLDVANKKQIGGMLKTINSKIAVFENWQKLNEILGSADGKKFRQIAQEYTLDILISYANTHLKILTNRYNLGRIPNTLALQVIDKDMGNEIRSVHSLSGGESFIVSLALALGLASLSSNKMKVESLFIDEGFGSLDPSTLSIAMDALEQLYNQGRKVGVISHVQEMTERIATQIRVIKQTNGKSKLEIAGF